MVQRARKREGLRLCRPAWLIGVSVREYRAIEAGDRVPSPATYERISELYGWPNTFVSGVFNGGLRGRSGRRYRPILRDLLKDIAGHVPHRELINSKIAGPVALRVRLLASKHDKQRVVFR
jgi:hypothetical protein